MNAASSSTQLIIIAVVFALLLVQRFRGRRVNPTRSLIVVAVFILLGVSAVKQALHAAHPSTLSHGDLTLLTILVLFSLGMGLLRGATVAIFVKDGELHSRYRVLTLVLWIVTFASRLAFSAASSHFDATQSVIEASLIMMFGISVAGEAIVVSLRTGAASPAAVAS